MSWSSADENSERAAREFVDTRTRDQKRWDDRSYTIADHVAHMRAMTYPDKMGWSRDPATLQALDDRLSDALREVRALQIEGFREGDPVGRIPDLKPIEVRPVGSEHTGTVVSLNGKGAA